MAARRFRNRKGKAHRPELVGAVLKSALARHGLDREIDRYNFVLEWDSIVGEQLAACTEPVCIQNHKLHIAVRDSSLAQELSFFKHAILSRVQAHMDNPDSVRDIVFKTGQSS